MVSDQRVLFLGESSSEIEQGNVDVLFLDVAAWPVSLLHSASYISSLLKSKPGAGAGGKSIPPTGTECFHADSLLRVLFRTHAFISWSSISSPRKIFSFAGKKNVCYRV